MIEFVLAATLLLRDPPGDAVGAGSLTPPTAEQYRNVGSFDLLEVEVPDTTMLSLSIELGALPNPAGLANGFSNPIVEVYIDAGDGGATMLLPGSQMRMPPGRGWEFAVRITGDGATAYRADDAQNGSGTAISYPVQIETDDRRIRVSTPFERPEIQGVYAITGVYDPFVQDGWRPLASSPSPWAFSSATQRRPVVDVLARDLVVQSDAIRDGVVPVRQNRIAGAMWMVLMALGLVVAGVGILLRRMVGSAQGEGAAVAAADVSEPASGSAASEPDGSPSEDSMKDALVAGSVLATLEFLPALPPPRTETPAATTSAWDGDHDAGWMDGDGTDDALDGTWSEGKRSAASTPPMPTDDDATTADPPSGDDATVSPSDEEDDEKPST